MGFVTPILDSLRPVGRSIDLQTVSRSFINAPLSELEALRAAARSGARPQIEMQQRAATVDHGTHALGRRRSMQTVTTDEGLPRGAEAGNSRPASAHLQLSNAGRFIASLLGQSLATSRLFASKATPLIDSGTPVNASRLAGILATQVSSSGVFYEAHLLQWMRGQRTFAYLQGEPQMRLTQSAHQAAGRPGARGKAASSSPGQGGSGVTAGHALVHPELSSLARQQIDVLSSGVFRWQGYVTPEIPMRWEVREHEYDDYEGHRGTNDDGDPSYTTSVHLDLARLGTFETRLTFSGGAIKMQIWAEQRESLDLFKEARDALRERLSEAGFPHITFEFVRGGVR